MKKDKSYSSPSLTDATFQHKTSYKTNKMAQTMSAAYLCSVDDELGDEEFDVEQVLGWVLHLVMQE